MKSTYIIFTVIIALVATSCSLNEDAGIKDQEVVTGFDGTFIQEDRVGRPAITTALITPNRKDAFNLAVTKDLNMLFKSDIEAELRKISPALAGTEDKNALGQDAKVLANLLATDVLNVSLVGKTTFFDGTNVLTGRTLDDDVLDTELLLIFGGEGGKENPTLTTDNVKNNDKDFQKVFPYLPTPW